LSTEARVGKTVKSIPDSGSRTFARPGVLIPDCSTLTVLNHCAELAIPLAACLANACFQSGVPYFAIDTENAGFSIPVEVGGADALEGGVTPYLATAAGFSGNAGGSVPDLALWADTDLIVSIVYSSTCAVGLILTIFSIPSVGGWAETGFSYGVPDLTIDTQQADSSIPVETSVAHTCTSIPCLASSTTGTLTVSVV